MKNIQLLVLAMPIALIGVAFLTLGAPPAAEASDKLTEVEMYKMESGTKDYVIDLIAAGVWAKDSDEYKQFNKYDPKAKLIIPKYNKERKDFEKETFPVTGAEYRRAFASAKAYANYSKLDKEGQKRVNMEFFGQETKPAIGSAKNNAGIVKAKNLLDIILGESVAATPTE